MSDLMVSADVVHFYTQRGRRNHFESDQFLDDSFNACWFKLAGSNFVHATTCFFLLSSLTAFAPLFSQIPKCLFDAKKKSARTRVVRNISMDYRMRPSPITSFAKTHQTGREIEDHQLLSSVTVISLLGVGFAIAQAICDPYD